MGKVGILMGSVSDQSFVDDTVKVLEDLGVDYEVKRWGCYN